MVLVPLILPVATIWPVAGQAVKNRYVQENDGWYYYGADGNAIRPQDGEVI